MPTNQESEKNNKINPQEHLANDQQQEVKATEMKPLKEILNKINNRAKREYPQNTPEFQIGAGMGFGWYRLEKIGSSPDSECLTYVSSTSSMEEGYALMFTAPRALERINFTKLMEMKHPNQGAPESLQVESAEISTITSANKSRGV